MFYLKRLGVFYFRADVFDEKKEGSKIVVTVVSYTYHTDSQLISMTTKLKSVVIGCHSIPLPYDNQ